jgi:glycosyltransferase involved in cell wall biosynthesis
MVPGVNGAAGAPRRHVVMLLLNPFTHDSRVEKEAATLRDAGYRVTVVARAEEQLPRIEVRDGIGIHRVARPRWPPFVRFFSHRRRMRRTVKRLRPDVIHAHDTETLDVAATAAAALGVPFVYDGHELWLERVRRERSKLYWWLARRYYAGIERRYIGRAAGHITVSEPIARHLERAYNLPEVVVVANYPDAGPPPRRLELRSLPGAARIPADAPIVLYVGNATVGRGVEQLIAAMARVPLAHLVLLGAAEQEGLVRRVARRIGVAERVHTLPRVAQSEVTAYASSASVGVSPILPSSLSYEYSLPNKLFQYMEAGLPVVASHFSQVREIIEGSGAGVTVDPADPNAMAAAIVRLLNDPAQRAEAGRRARIAFEARYNWTTAAAVLLALYRRVTESQRGGKSAQGRVPS